MMIQVQKLTQEYHQGESLVRALHDIDFTINKEKTVALVGPSGSGKTTLLTLLAGLDRPTSGHILMDGTDLTKLSEPDLARFRTAKSSIVFQQFHLMPYLSALENVMLPLEIRGHQEPLRQAQTILQQVGLESRLHHLPHELSGGECQRVAIARAFVTQPPLLLADEPSGNLDTATGQKVMDLLFQMNAEREQCLILVTHDRKLAERCERVIELRGGKLL